jgi:hypothetical protein
MIFWNSRHANYLFFQENILLEKSQAKVTSENESCSEILSLFREVPCASISSVNETSPVKIGTKEKKSHLEKTTNAIINLESNAPTDEVNMDSEATETKVNTRPINMTNCNMSGTDGGEVGGSVINENQPANPGNNQHCPHIPLSFLGYPGFSPFLSNCHCNNQDATYISFLKTSSTFTSLLMSTLLQNPAVHAAARLAASYWTSPVEADGTNAMDSQNPNPSLAAIAAATVAAASAWWAAHGLLPLFPPIAVPFAPGPTNVTPESQANQNHEKNSIIPDLPKEDACDSDESAKGEKKDSRPTILTSGSNKKKNQDPSSCGSNTPSSSDVETDNIPEKNVKAPVGDNGVNDGLFGNTNVTPSLVTELMNSRRGRSSTSANESVSEEVVKYQNLVKLETNGFVSKSHCFSNVYLSCQGRLAFQALFKREVLPQSFSPPQAKEGEQGKGEGRENEKEEGEIEETDSAIVSTVDLNKDACVASDLINPFLTFQGTVKLFCYF